MSILNQSEEASSPTSPASGRWKSYFKAAGMFFKDSSGNEKQVASVDYVNSASNTTASNVGEGEGVFRSKTGGDLAFKSLVAGSNIAITGSADIVTIKASGSASPSYTEYKFSTSTTDSDPNQGKFRLNASTRATATFIYINKATDNNVDISLFLVKIDTNDLIYLQDYNTSSSHVRYKATGASVQSGNYFKIPIVVDQAAVGAELSNDSTTALVFSIAAFGGTNTLGYTPENIVNKVQNDTIINADTYFSTQGTVDQIAKSSLASSRNYFTNTNSGVSTYKTFSTVKPQTATNQTIVDTTTATGDIVAAFISEVGKPNSTVWEGGLFTISIMGKGVAAGGAKTVEVKADIYKRTSGGAETLLASTAYTVPFTATDTVYNLTCDFPQSTVNLTDSAVIKFVANVGGAGGTITTTLTIEGVSTSSFTSPVESLGYTPEDSANKDISSGYVGKTLEKINFWNTARTFRSFFTNANTAVRTYTYQDKDGTIADLTDVGSGWVSISDTWTYSSADSPTFIITIPTDGTTKYSVGMRVKLTQTTVKYFIVTAVTATTLTVYGGTDYTLANTAITLPSFSSNKAPFGFPQNPLKWDIEVTTAITFSQATPTVNVWYSANSINVPIGAWDLSYRVNLRSTSNAAQVRTNASSTLSTANNSESDTRFTYTAISSGLNDSIISTVPAYCCNSVVLTAKETRYLNIRTTLTTTAIIEFQNAAGAMVLRARFLYL
jgi:hypothetical protein